MARVILFDLDGTLLPVDTHHFVEESLKIMAQELADFIEPEQFLQAIWVSIQQVVANLDPHRTNEQVFKDSFIRLTGLHHPLFWRAVERFYADVFPTLQFLCQPTDLARKITEEALSQGYRLVVATNPLYPAPAIWMRMQWAGVAHVPFEWVTTYENSCFAKPNLEYYEEICSILKVKPEECLMVGNDMQEDMVVTQLGMTTYLVVDWLIDRGQPCYKVDERGSLAQLYDLLRKKQGIFA